jgi:hypothetical protein
MHIPLVIAILAVLTFALLPILDHFGNSENRTKGWRAYLIRIARWTQE